MRWVFLLLFGKHFWNYLQMPSKCSNIMSSLCEIFLRKYSMLGTDEDGRMFFLHNELLVYIFKCKWNRETAISGQNVGSI